MNKATSNDTGSMWQGLFRLLRLTMRYPGHFFWLLGFGFLYGGVTASFTPLVKAFVDTLTNPGDAKWKVQALGYIDRVPLLEPAGRLLREGTALDIFVGILVVGGVLMLLKCITAFGRAYLQAWLTNRVMLDVQNEMADHLLTLDLGYFDQERTGDLLSRMTNDLAQLGASVKLTCVLLTRPVTVLLVLATLFALNWRLTLFGLVAAPVGALIVSRLYKKMWKAGKRAQEKRGDLTSVTVQFLGGMRTVKAFACEDFESQQFRGENRRLFRHLMKRARARAWVKPVVEVVNSLGALVVMYIGGRWVLSEELTAGDFMAFMAALGLMHAPAKLVSSAFSEVQEALPGAQRVYEVLDYRPHMKDGTRELSPFAESIRYDNVHFAYHADKPVLRGIDLEIRKGETVALVGKSGAGKSTLADLIPRFYDPHEGAVRIDGVDVREATYASLRSQVAVVSQEPFLFKASVRANIAYGLGDVSMERIERAARAANVHDEILQLAEGYDTPVGERGGNLSGGQRQRVAIARALFKDAPILILDEATSSLDAENERLVQAALEHLMEGRTSLVIAHRLSTVRHADRIVVVEEGRLTAAGRHEELLETSPTYAEFVRLQSEGMGA